MTLTITPKIYYSFSCSSSKKSITERVCEPQTPEGDFGEISAFGREETAPRPVAHRPCRGLVHSSKMLHIVCQKPETLSS